jgi:hypothetical protein
MPNIHPTPPVLGDRVIGEPVLSHQRTLIVQSVGTEMGGCRIVRVLTPNAERGEDCIYRVEFLCCGRSETTTHQLLMQRHSRRLCRCIVCSNKARSPWTPDQRADAVALRARGKSVRKISMAVGVPEGTVAGWCRAVGL